MRKEGRSKEEIYRMRKKKRAEGRRVICNAAVGYRTCMFSYLYFPLISILKEEYPSHPAQHIP